MYINVAEKYFQNIVQIKYNIALHCNLVIIIIFSDAPFITKYLCIINMYK
jgi:hypothetical protein